MEDLAHWYLSLCSCKCGSQVSIVSILWEYHEKCRHPASTRAPCFSWNQTFNPITGSWGAPVNDEKLGLLSSWETAQTM